VRLWIALAVAAALLAATPAARADDFEAALHGLARPSGADVARAVEALGAGGDPRALGLLEALRDGAVAVTETGQVYLRGSDGVLHDAAAGPAGAGPGAQPTRPPTIDNEVRRVLDPLIARLELRAPSPETRLAAAEELARRADPDDAPALRDAIAREQVPAVREALAAALAELGLASDDPETRLEAVRAIERSGKLKLAPRLEALVARRPDGAYAEPDPRVREAAEGALRSLHRKRLLVDGAANVFYGLSSGSVLLLAALGLAITFGLMRVINMAHGEMVMLGAYATYATQTFFRAHWPDHVALSPIAALPVALLTCMAVGAALERAVIRFLYGRPLETLLATYGLSLVLIQVVRSVFGAQNVEIESPRWLSGGAEISEDIVVPYNRIAIVAFAVAVTAFVAYVLRGTSLGLRVRAVTQNRAMAACMGIATAKVDTWTFALGCGVGGLAGVALAQLGNVGPELGQGVIVDSFLVVVLGGVGKLVGCVIAALSLGILNKLLEQLEGAVLGKIVVLVTVVLFIQKRPQGLFAPRGRGLEAV
jgi:urea transport system permease protein